MKFLHLSDLHLGKRVNGFSMIEDQHHILTQILQIAGENEPDAVLIAGDVYDRSVPSVEAMQLLDTFLVELHRKGCAVCLISGNHDSVERMAFAASLLQRNSIHISPVYHGRLEPLVFPDDFGDVRVWLLPYLKPSLVRPHFPGADITSYTDALSAALRETDPDPAARNVLVAHQFVTGALQSDSEEFTVGGSENVDASLFDAFDYVALGHIHRPQHVGRNTLRYCGTPLKYSFSEAGHTKTITLVEMGAKGDIGISEIPLTPLRDLREIRGEYLEVSARQHYQGTDTGDYVRIVLTDEEEEPDAARKLRSIYPNLMRLDYDNTRSRTRSSLEAVSGIEEKAPIELLEELYTLQNGHPMSPEQQEYAHALFREIQEADR